MGKSRKKSEKYNGNSQRSHGHNLELELWHCVATNGEPKISTHLVKPPCITIHLGNTNHEQLELGRALGVYQI